MIVPLSAICYLLSAICYLTPVCLLITQAPRAQKNMASGAGLSPVTRNTRTGIRRDGGPEGIKPQPGNNVLMDLASAVRVGISLLPGS
jgi:hypothetical protein